MSQEQKILNMLRSQEWVTTVDAVNNRILRIGAIIFNLKGKGYSILSEKVPGKSYQRYRLLSEDLVILKDKDGQGFVSHSSIQQTPKHESVEINQRVSPEKVGRDLFHLQTSLPL